jgi:hypothetical protein
LLSFMTDKRKKGQLVVAGATIGKAHVSRSSSQQSSRDFQWRDSDDSDYRDEQAEPVQRRSLRTGRRAPKNKNMKSPEVVDMCNSDSEIEEVGGPEESTVRWVSLLCDAMTYMLIHAICCSQIVYRLSWT